MQRRQKLLLSFVVGVLMLFYGTTVIAALTPPEIAKIAEGSTVVLGIFDAQVNLLARGSGFFVGPDLIATNYHVIEAILNEGAIGGVKLVGKEEIYAIENIVDFDKKNDLAIAKVRRANDAEIDVPALSLGDSDAVQRGEPIYIMSNPLGLEGTFTDGKISNILSNGNAKILQINATIAQGSSGGPVLNESGKVIGICVAGIGRGLDINFAIPVNYLKALMLAPPTPVKPKPVKPKVSPPPVKPQSVKPQADPPSAKPKSVLAPQEIAKIALGSTVHLLIDGLIDGESKKWTGSGFVVHNGQIATNHHVIDNMSIGGVRLVGKEKIYPIEVVLAVDTERDLAIVKAAGIDAPTLSLGDSDTVEVMDTVYVAGNPQGLEGTVVPGNISAIRQSRDRVPLKFFQMTAPISQGSSGGPVFNERGEVIGVSFATLHDGQNLNFAIPVNYLKPLIKMPIAPPIMTHNSPSKISVGEIIPLTLDLISSQVSQQVTIHYKTYDKNRNELEQNNQKMRLGNQQSASSTWVYKVDLPAQKHVGSIEYYITVEYENHLIFRHPEDEYRHYQISIVDEKPPTITLLYPPDGARFGANQEITVRAEVTDNVAVKDVHIHTSWFNSQKSQRLFAESSSNIYTIDITLENIVSLRYYLTATDEEGNASRSESRHLEMKITTQENLEKGIKLYEQARYSEAIKALNSAIQELEDPKQRAEAHLYLGCSKRGSGEGIDEVREQFQETIRYNPDQKLPPRLGKDHPIFAELIEEVREELTGELTVISLLPQTEIWIEGNNIDRKMLGTGIIISRLLTGDYIVEGIDAEQSQRKTITIEPNHHKVLNLEIPPTVKHASPPRISVGERVPLTLNLISTKSPQQVKIYYKTYDRDKDQLEQSNQEMSLWAKQSASSTWTYKVDLPSQKRVGSIEYYIEVEYDGHLVFKYPSTQVRYYQISIVDEKPLIISLLYPPDGANFKRNQEIAIRAEVRSSLSIKAVHVHFSSGSRQKMSQENSSDVYTTSITVSQPLRYYLIATDEAGNTNESRSRRIEIKVASTEVDDAEAPEPEHRADQTRTDSQRNASDSQQKEGSQEDPSDHPPVSPGYEGIWASISTDGASTLDSDGNYMFRLAYLREGKNRSTLGAQLNFAYPDRTNMSAMVQWGLPALGKSSIALTLLGGIAQYEDAPAHITPIFGAGLKFYPRDKIAIDAISSIKLGAYYDMADLYHYEVGIRFYITRELSLRAGYSQLFLGNRDVSTIQVGLGYTF